MIVNFSNNDFGDYDFNEDINPLSDFDVTVDMDIDDTRPKPQAHGLYPTPSYRRGMTIDLQGTILADDSADYIDKRKTMVHALYGDNFTALVSENQMGILSLTLDGETEDWQTPCTVRAFSAPMTWTQGAYTLYMVTFYSWTPYFTGSDDPTNLYRWS